jgi:hypothetical protein
LSLPHPLPRSRAQLLVLLTLVLALLGGLWPNAARADGTGGKVAGMVLSSIGQTEPSDAAMAKMKADGINTVSLFVWWWAAQSNSTTLEPYSGTQSDADLTAEIDAAHSYGLKVILSPIFNCGGCEGQWRGVMQPSDVPAFFASYKTFMDHYARLAQSDGVWLLFVGSEMTSLEGQTAQWESVISEARQYYSGLIGYEQNWDVVGQPQFLSDVDVVGVSAYFPLDDSANPSLSQLLADWNDSQDATYSGHNWVGSLIHLANSTGKPILFGEVGYMDSDYAARQPFTNNYYTSDPTLQANLYQALLQTFSGYSWWMGVAWWEWSDASTDQDRTPVGKPAETLLQNWYVSGWRPGSATSSASSSGSAVPTLGLSPTGAEPSSRGGATVAGSVPPTSDPAGTTSGGLDSHGASTSVAAPATPTSIGPGLPEAGPGTTSVGLGSPGGSSLSSARTLEAAASTAAGAASPALPGRDRLAGPGVVAVIALALALAGIPLVGLQPLAERRRRRPRLNEPE